MAKFLLCKTCGNMAGMIKDVGAPLSCCGSDMAKLEPNTEEASTEKHLPAVTTTANGIKVSIGSVLHPMTKDHHIEFIYVKTERGGQRVQLDVDTSPEVEFSFVNDKPVEAYAYCNLHGLWKTELSTAN